MALKWNCTDREISPLWATRTLVLTWILSYWGAVISILAAIWKLKACSPILWLLEAKDLLREREREELNNIPLCVKPATDESSYWIQWDEDPFLQDILSNSSSSWKMKNEKKWKKKKKKKHYCKGSKMHPLPPSLPWDIRFFKLDLPPQFYSQLL